jgi:hypothetical protein
MTRQLYIAPGRCTELQPRSQAIFFYALVPRPPAVIDLQSLR